jgi:hypothetical protein
MRLRTIAAILTIAAGSVAAAAFADKATVKLEQPAPVLMRENTAWNALFKLSRRGRRLDGYRPVIEIEDAQGRRRYLGTETAPGVYRARVVFPRIGPWKYRIRIGSETVKTGTMHVTPS